MRKRGREYTAFHNANGTTQYIRDVRALEERNALERARERAGWVRGTREGLLEYLFAKRRVY